MISSQFIRAAGHYGDNMAIIARERLGEAGLF